VLATSNGRGGGMQPYGSTSKGSTSGAARGAEVVLGAVVAVVGVVVGVGALGAMW